MLSRQSGSSSDCACWICWLSSALCGAAGRVWRATRSRSCGWTRCAGGCTACTCRPWPPWFCRCVCCRPGTVAGFSGCASCRWHTATPGSSVGSSTLFRSLLRSSWEAPAGAGTRPRTLAPSEGWCWCTGRRKCIWWTAAPGSPLELDLQETGQNCSWDRKQLKVFGVLCLF